MVILGYRVSEIPDPSYPRYQLTAGGNARSAIGEGFTQILRCISVLPPASARLSVLFVFVPLKPAAKAQCRLALYLVAEAQDEQTAATLASLIESGPIAPYYELKSVQQPSIPWEEMRTSCYILRRESAIRPSQPPEANDRIPAYYYTILPFEANVRNDWSLLDRVLATSHDPVVVEITVSPTDIAGELAEHTRYLGLLKSINHSWERDDEEAWETMDYLGTGRNSGLGSRPRLGPRRLEDPLAEDILRRQRRFHETLISPNLSFRLRVATSTASMARLVAAIVGESAFVDGSYALFPHPTEVADPSLGGLSPIAELPTQQALFGGEPLREYAGLSRLPQVASAAELIGVFRLPVAGQASPWTILRNTDPPPRDAKELIVAGHDLDPPPMDRGQTGIPRGPRIGHLTKHMFISGMTGMGKTRAVISLAIQLHNLLQEEE